MRKFRILSVLLCAVLALSTAACNGGEQTASGSESKAESAVASSAEEAPASSDEELGPYDHRKAALVDNVGKWRVTGRTAQIMDESGNQGMIYDHAAQGFFFQADCEGDLFLRLSIKIPTQNADRTYSTHFLVRVDGVEKDVIHETTTAVELPVKLTIAEGLARGKHSVEVYRCNEYSKSRCVLNAVELDGTLLPYEAPKKDLTIAFLGDSVTSGACVYSVNHEESSFIGDSSDATKSYAFIAANLLNADFTVSSRSGSYSAKGTEPDSIYYTYDYVSRSRSEDLYDNTKDKVDVFVISLGTNDTKKRDGEYIFTDEQIKANVTALLQRVRADHPKAKIVWTYGQMTLDKANVIRGAVNAFAAADGNTWYYQYTTPNSEGGAYHPTAAAQKLDGEELAAFIKGSVLN